MENISLLEAFGHAMSFASYWLWLSLALGAAYGTYRFYAKEDIERNGWTAITKGLLFFFLALVLSAFLISPCTIKANTTKDMAKRGVYIR